ncbi:hypothetical protein BV22DRAFT_1134692 [Leucogyrophana mollusca]|uniref:Uncharacterized protein n=1 Tax=Leucogyrophana mollusca TaxID=85980 RepID=A0ACB8AY33_9AGAM|nr:hypothetical protein BV22DRAFT_1134692 [Leucogyrophana mollusca]
MPLLARCFCTSFGCNGALISTATKHSHEREDLHSTTVDLQSRHVRVNVPLGQAFTGPVSPQYTVSLHEPAPSLPSRVLFEDPPRASSSAVEQEMLDHGVLTGEDINILTFGSELPDLGPHFHSPEALHTAIDHYAAHNAAAAAGARQLTSHAAHTLSRDPQQRMIDRQVLLVWEEGLTCLDTADGGEAEAESDAELGEPDEDVDIDEPNQEQDDADLTDNAHTVLGPLASEWDEDNPDLFLIDKGFSHNNDNDLSSMPPHLIVIYALVTWLHLQWHLPRAACNALLAIITCVLAFVAPHVAAPFVTLQLATRVLSLDIPIHILPCCPSCCEVYPPAESLHSHEMCVGCEVPLFLPATTKQGNQRKMRVPRVKYPYLPLSQQLKSIIKVPGVEQLLDAWRTKTRTPGRYTDIFNGAMCRTKLQDPAGQPFEQFASAIAKGTAYALQLRRLSASPIGMPMRQMRQLYQPRLWI